MSQDQKLPSNTDAPSLLSQLFQQETQVLDDSQGLAKFEGFRVHKASEFTALDSRSYKAIKEALPLFPDLPKAPSLGALSFLLKQGSKDIREQFEDHWTTSCLTYAAACQVHVLLSEAVEQKVLPEDQADLFAALRRLICCASNGPAA